MITQIEQTSATSSEIQARTMSQAGTAICIAPSGSCYKKRPLSSGGIPFLAITPGSPRDRQGAAVAARTVRLAGTTIAFTKAKPSRQLSALQAKATQRIPVEDMAVLPATPMAYPAWAHRIRGAGAVMRRQRPGTARGASGNRFSAQDTPAARLASVRLRYA